MSKLELKILRLLWVHQAVTAKAMLALMETPRPAYSTLSLTLRLMCHKGLIFADKSNNKCTYSPLVNREEILRIRMDEISLELFGVPFKELSDQ